MNSMSSLLERFQIGSLPVLSSADEPMGLREALMRANQASK